MNDSPRRPLVEGEDYYLEGPYMVFTELYLRRRGSCCRSLCRHCPYGFRREEKKDSGPDEE